VAELRFFYGTMGSGKSTLALQIHHNLTRAGQHGLLITQLDRVEAAISSRLGVAQPAIEVDDEVDLRALVLDVVSEMGRVDYVIGDEAQFYAPEQVEQLADLADDHSVEVYAFGLLTDFRGRLFAGSARFMELADTRHEMHIEARCWCGRPATHNARLFGGRQVYEGETVLVGDIDEACEVTYELRCRRHWRTGRGAGAGEVDLRDPAAAGSRPSGPPGPPRPT
jgi:thymidine kinase